MGLVYLWWMRVALFKTTVIQAAVVLTGVFAHSRDYARQTIWLIITLQASSQLDAMLGTHTPSNLNNVPNDAFHLSPTVCVMVQ
jgi:hypothetical protein